MPIRTLALVLLLATASLGERPVLGTMLEELTGASPSIAWRSVRLSEGFDDTPEDCELQFRPGDLPVMIAFAGPRSAVRSVTAVVGPIDPSTTDGKRAIAFARDTVARTSGLGRDVVGDWLKRNREALLTPGKMAAPTTVRAGETCRLRSARCSLLKSTFSSKTSASL